VAVGGPPAPTVRPMSYPLALPWAITAVIVAAAAITAVGPRMVHVADRLADRTGLGEAFVGAVMVGAATSIPDIIATVVPAVNGLPDLAVGNALGGVLAQTAFLAIADLSYRRANLEHAAASVPNLVQATVLIALLGGVLTLFASPDVTVLGFHPGSYALVLGYVFSLRLVNETTNAPMWEAVETSETRQDVPDEPEAADAAGTVPLLLRFAGLAAILAAAGFALAIGGENLVEEAGLGEAAVGVFVTGVSSSLAELVVSISAVRAGALTLAVANVIGGNTFDTLLVVVADGVYRDGSVYAAVGPEAAMVAAVTIVMTAVITLGLLRRERHGFANIGTESVVVLGLYLGALVLIL
jgi:cation:H+ antiporter